MGEREMEGRTTVVQISFSLSFLFLCGNFQIFNGHVTALFHCRNPSQYLFFFFFRTESSLCWSGHLTSVSVKSTSPLPDEYFTSIYIFTDMALSLISEEMEGPYLVIALCECKASDLTPELIFKNTPFRQNTKYTFCLESKSIDRPFKK